MARMQEEADRELAELAAAAAAAQRAAEEDVDPWGAVATVDIVAVLANSPQLRKILELFPPEKSGGGNRTVFSIIWVVFRHFAFSGGGDAMHASSLNRMQLRAFLRSLGVLRESAARGGARGARSEGVGATVSDNVKLDRGLADVYFSQCLARRDAARTSRAACSTTALSLPQFQHYLLLLALRVYPDARAKADAAKQFAAELLVPFAKQLGAELVATMAAESPPEARLVEAALVVLADKELAVIFDHYRRVRLGGARGGGGGGPGNRGSSLAFGGLVRFAKDFGICGGGCFVKTNAELQRLFYSANFDQVRARFGVRCAACSAAPTRCEV